MTISKEAKVGVVGILALACFIFGFNYLKGINFFSSQNKFYAVYDDIDGLVEANPLIVNGYKVGLVSEIRFIPDGSHRIVVSMLLDNKIKVPSNSTAKVVSSDILGSKAIDLLIGDSPTFAVSGDTLISAMEDDLATSVNKSIAPLKKKAEGLISSVDSVMIVVQEVLNKDARKNLSKSFSDVSKAIFSLQTTAYRLDTLVKSQKKAVESITSNLSEITTTIKNKKDELDNAIGNFSAISDSLVKANITSTINHADKTLEQTASILHKIDSGEGSMGMLINNDSLYINLAKASEDLDKLLIDVKEHPKRYVRFSLFGGKN